MRCKRLLKNNAGFTLVELIIVIAIIAVLSAAIVPRYIQYVEKSRIGVDEQYIGEVAHTLATIAATDPKVNTAPVTVTFDTAGKIQGCSAAGANAAETKAAVDADLAKIFPDEIQQFQSGYFRGTAADHSAGVSLVLDADGFVAISGTKNINT